MPAWCQQCVSKFSPGLQESVTQDIGRRLSHPPGGAGSGGYSHTLRVCAAQRGRDFEAPYLERGIHFRGVF